MDLNQPSKFDDTVLNAIPQWGVATYLDNYPTLGEVQRAINQLSSGKAPGADSIPPEIYKEGGLPVAQCLTELFTKIWDTETVPQEFKDAMIVHIYKRTGDRAACDNH